MLRFLLPSSPRQGVIPFPGKVSRLTTYIFLAVAYVVSGKLGLMLALPPGYASPIFPPAGIAVTAAFIAGRGTLPWVFLGSFALNVWVGYSANHHFNDVELSAALIIATASMLQASLGGWALRRTIGYPAPIDNGRDVLRFLVLAPAICLTSSTLSVSGLTALRVVDMESFITNWGSWWVGDTLGVVVMLPLVMVIAGEPRAVWRNRIRSVAAPMALVFALFVVIFIQTNKWEQSDSLVEFHLQSQETVDQIQAHLEEQEFILDQLKGFFVHDVNGRITRQEFHRYVQPSLANFPMIQALEWAPRVDSIQRASFEASQHRDLPSFEIRERDTAGKMRRASMRYEYYPVTYVEPLKSNEPAMGFDIASQLDRRAALNKAIEKGGMVATSPIHLVQEHGQQMGILLLLPVKTDGRITGTILTVLQMNKFMDGLLRSKWLLLHARLVDLDDQKILYDNFVSETEKALFERSFEFGTRHYQLQTAPTTLYLKLHRGWQSWGVLAMGVLGTGLLGSLIMLITGHAARIEEQVRERTHDLEESEAKLEEITTTLGEGVYVMDDKGIVTFTNPEAERLLGWWENELIGHDAHRLFHIRKADGPFLSQTDCEISKVVRTGQIFRSDREVFWRKDGTPMPVSVTSAPIARGDRIAGAVVVFNDITERKLNEQKVQESEERFRLISTAAKEAIIILSEEEEITYWNPAAETIFGYSAKEALYRSLHELVAPMRYHNDFRQGFKQFVISGDGPLIGKTFEITAIRKSGEEFPIELSISSFQLKGQWHAMGIIRDISERKKMEQEYKTIIQTTMDGFLVVDAHDGRFLDVNDAYCKMLGYSREEVLRLGTSDVEAIESPVQVEEHQAELRRVGQAQFETRHRRKNGGVIDVEISITYLDMRGGIFFAFIRDISGRKKTEEQIRQLAYYDTLTNLPNRRLLLDRLHQALFQAKRYQRSVAVMFLDLDHFKLINDTLGHDAGDELLRAVAIRLNSSVRHGDTVCRQGGDEFVIVLAEIAHPQDAALVAEKIIDAMRAPLLVKDHELLITTSIGISIYPVNGTDDARELMKKADIAMYEAKGAGRNGYRFYSD